jgi:hypothetical protein
MQRDMDLIRELLIRVEHHPCFDGQNWATPDIQGDLVSADHPLEEVNYHLELLIEAGYLKGQSRAGFGVPVISKMTWEGHEFLDNIRDNDIWHKTKKRIEGLPGVALKVVASIAEAEIKKRLGL